MTDISVSIPAEQYERLDALASARGVSVERQLARLVDDAYEGVHVGVPAADDLPLGVCDEPTRE